ncbi:DUF3486 family protein [Pseudoalteromonas sp. Hal056]
MNDTVRRGKPSKVDLLPEDIKKRLDEMLRDKRFSQAEILDAVNSLIIESGLDEGATISRSWPKPPCPKNRGDRPKVA